MITISNEWRNKIKVRHLLDEETSENHVKKVAEAISKELQRVLDLEEKLKTLSEDDLSDISWKLIETKDNFDFVVTLFYLSKENRIIDYEIYEPLYEVLNGYLTDLYDLADERVTTKRGVSQKFMWVG